MKVELAKMRVGLWCLHQPGSKLPISPFLSLEVPNLRTSRGRPRHLDQVAVRGLRVQEGRQSGGDNSISLLAYRVVSLLCHGASPCARLSPASQPLTECSREPCAPPSQSPRVGNEPKAA